LAFIDYKEAAIDCYDKAIALNPNFAEFYYNKGVVLYNLGKKEEAMASYDAALKLNPGYAQAVYFYIMWENMRKL
jgi:tetratricopeptide (TPR) repeat protein